MEEVSLRSQPLHTGSSTITMKRLLTLQIQNVVITQLHLQIPLLEDKQKIRVVFCSITCSDL